MGLRVWGLRSGVSGCRVEGLGSDIKSPLSREHARVYRGVERRVKTAT